MRWFLYLFATVLLATCSQIPKSVPSASQVDNAIGIYGFPCISDRNALLALDQAAFDENLSGGWREVSYRKGCRLAAADLLRDYRAAHPEAKMTILFWHEGQTRAMEGDIDSSISLLKQAYKVRDQAWNYYVSATISFLEKDADALDQAHAGLSAMPRPEYWDETSADFETKYGYPLRWHQ